MTTPAAAPTRPADPHRPDSPRRAARSRHDTTPASQAARVGETATQAGETATQAGEKATLAAAASASGAAWLAALREAVRQLSLVLQHDDHSRRAATNSDSASPQTTTGTGAAGTGASTSTSTRMDAGTTTGGVRGVGIAGAGSAFLIEAAGLIDRAGQLLTVSKNRVLRAQADDLAALKRRGQRDIEHAHAAATRQGIGSAGREVRHAQDLATLPDTEQALSDGAITVKHAEAMTAFLHGGDTIARRNHLTTDQHHLLQAAQREDAGMFRRRLKRVAAQVDARSLQETHNQVRARRFLRMTTRAGGVHGEFMLDQVAAAEFRAGLDAHLPRPTTDETRTTEQRRADALVAMATLSSEAIAYTSGGRIKPRVIITMDTHTLTHARQILDLDDNTRDTRGTPSSSTTPGTDKPGTDETGTDETGAGNRGADTTRTPATSPTSTANSATGEAAAGTSCGTPSHRPTTGTTLPTDCGPAHDDVDLSLHDAGADSGLEHVDSDDDVDEGLTDLDPTGVHELAGTGHTTTAPPHQPGNPAPDTGTHPDTGSHHDTGTRIGHGSGTGNGDRDGRGDGTTGLNPDDPSIPPDPPTTPTHPDTTTHIGIGVSVAIHGGPGSPGVARGESEDRPPPMPPAPAMLQGRILLPPSELARMLCDSDIGRAVVDTKGHILDIGRASRTVPAATRLALITRDQGCTYPGCAMPPAYTHAHHIHWWSQGGRTNRNNLLLLCAHHHLYSIHTIGITITPIDGGFKFHHPNGTLIGTTYHAHNREQT